MHRYSHQEEEINQNDQVQAADINWSLVKLFYTTIVNSCAIKLLRVPVAGLKLVSTMDPKMKTNVQNIKSCKSKCRNDNGQKVGLHN